MSPHTAVESTIERVALVERLLDLGSGHALSVHHVGEETLLDLLREGVVDEVTRMRVQQYGDEPLEYLVGKGEVDGLKFTLFSGREESS